MRAKKSLGQNFLTGSHYPGKIVESVAPKPGEPIIEIGPGHGALTGLLLDTGADLIAIELDADLVPVLEAKFGGFDNFRLLRADILEIDPCELVEPGRRARVVANLPYYISTPILQYLIAHRRCIAEAIVMLQREVVERIVAGPGSKDYGYLSVLIQFHCQTVKLFDVPPGAFRPAPKVVSSVLRMTILEEPKVPVQDQNLFLELIKVLFAQRRKTILNNLKSGWSRISAVGEAAVPAVLERAGIEPGRRAETLSIAEIARLSDAVLAGSGTGHDHGSGRRSGS